MNYFNKNKDNYKTEALVMWLLLGSQTILTNQVFGSDSIIHAASATQDTVVIDFDRGEFTPGDIVSVISYPNGSITVFGSNPDFPGKNAAMIFDSANPTGGDLDLGTPNELFGGPGINLEGGTVQSNNVPLNNILIVSEDLNSAEPDDATAEDISLTFDFSPTVILVSINLLDLDSGDAIILLYDSLGNEIFSINIPETGCNGVTTVVLNIAHVARMEVRLNGSGAIDNITFVSNQGTGSANTNPNAEDDRYSTDIDTPLGVTSPGVLANDLDLDGDNLTIIAHDSITVSGGIVELDPNGGFSYTPPNGFEGDDTFTYVITDGKGGTDTASVNIAVIRGATDPVANNDVYATNKNTVLIIEAPGVLENDTDPNGDVLSVIGYDNTGAQGGTVELNTDGSFTYTPATDSINTDTFTYIVSDGKGNMDTALVSIHIIVPPGGADGNSPPIAVADTVMTDLDLELVVTDPQEGILVNDSDPDGDKITALEVSNAITDQGGSISINADGTFSYSPRQGFVGVDTYEYTICDDGEPQLCDSAIISIEVKELPVKVFDAFSPNGDGINDSWVIQGITQFPNNHVQIFNRWGNLVYQVRGYDNTANVWQGQSTEGIVFGKNEVPDGGYFYVINLGDGSKRISGFVVVRR